MHTIAHLDQRRPMLVLRQGLFLGEVGIVAAASILLLNLIGQHGLTLTASYAPWTGNPAAVAEFATWLLSAASEPNFYTSAISGLGLIVGGTVAHVLSRRHSRWQGFVQACGSGLWVPMVCSSLLGLLLSNLIWGWTLAATHAWQPLFAPFVSASPTIVLLYGASSATVLTGAVLGATIVTPMSLLAVNYLCAPLSIAPVVGVTGGMAAGSTLAFLLCRRLPWMPVPLHMRTRGDAEAPGSPQLTRPTSSPVWKLRRILADFSEAQFFGSEWASLGLISGAIFAFTLNPYLPAYGSGLFPAILATQVLTGAIGVTLWRNQWTNRPFYPTFVPIVSIAPAVILTYGATIEAILLGALLGALIAPPVAAAISQRLPTILHPFIGNVASMAVCTLLIVPTLGLVPGFTP